MKKKKYATKLTDSLKPVFIRIINLFHKYQQNERLESICAALKENKIPVTFVKYRSK